MSGHAEIMEALLGLAHQLGEPSLRMAILGEGNASATRGDGTFLVKASGSTLATLDEGGVVACRSRELVELLDRGDVSDADVRQVLLASRVSPDARTPSVEALFHAWLLTLPHVNVVGHTHAPAVTGVVCSPRAREFADKRLFPDEVVCCDVASVLVPYTDPGVWLARAIRERTSAFLQAHGRAPRVILLENHGIITLGRTAEATLAAMLMAEKAARIWIRAATLGGPVFMTPEHVARIAARPDEAHRRRILER